MFIDIYYHLLPLSCSWARAPFPATVYIESESTRSDRENPICPSLWTWTRWAVVRTSSICRLAAVRQNVVAPFILSPIRLVPRSISRTSTNRLLRADTRRIQSREEPNLHIMSSVKTVPNRHSPFTIIAITIRPFQSWSFLENHKNVLPCQRRRLPARRHAHRPP